MTPDITGQQQALLEKRARARAVLEEIKHLLKKADARRKTEPAHLRRWNSVLDNLEFSLDEAKARLEACERELERMGAAAAQYEGSPVQDKAPWLSESAPDLDEHERHLLQAPIEQLSKCSLEEISLVQSHLMDQSAEENPEAEHLLGRLELANQVREDPIGPAKPEDPNQCRKQLLLRGAIDKIQSNHIDTMLPEETQLVLSCYSLLTRRLNPTPKDERLIRILGAAIKVIKRRRAQQRHAGTNEP